MDTPCGTEVGTKWIHLVGRSGQKWDISGAKVGHKWIHTVGRCGTMWDISGTEWDNSGT